MTIFDFLGRLQNVTGGHGQYSAKCPAHDDRRASLRIAAGEDGRILVKCQAGCDVRDVVSSLGLTMEDLFPGDGIHREPRRAKAPFIATYHYGRGLEKLRRADKSFLWRQPDGAGGWIWKKPAGKLLYHLEEIRPGSTVLVVEGEKDVDTLFRLGLDAASRRCRAWEVDETL